jgi:hypothetical protein
MPKKPKKPKKTPAPHPKKDPGASLHFHAIQDVSNNTNNTKKKKLLFMPEFSQREASSQQRQRDLLGDGVQYHLSFSFSLSLPC